MRIFEMAKKSWAWFANFWLVKDVAVWVGSTTIGSVVIGALALRLFTPLSVMDTFIAAVVFAILLGTIAYVIAARFAPKVRLEYRHDSTVQLRGVQIEGVAKNFVSSVSPDLTKTPDITLFTVNDDADVEMDKNSIHGPFKVFKGNDRVKLKASGNQIVYGPSIQFPAPAGEFSGLSRDELVDAVHAVMAELRSAQADWTHRARQNQPRYIELDGEEREAERNRHSEENERLSHQKKLYFQTRFLHRTKAITCELISRIPGGRPKSSRDEDPALTHSINFGEIAIWNDGGGATPFEDAAAFLDFLVERLPL